MHTRQRPVAGLLGIVALAGVLFGCRQEIPPLFRRNQPPETTLTIVPEDSTQGFYSYRVYWHGEDRDGRVVRYIFAITDTMHRNEEDDWDPQLAEHRERSSYTERTDSTFTFDSARGRAAFHIAAIDDYGRVDRTPARAFFRIVDNGLPRVEFLEVRTPRPDIAACVGTEACSVPTFTDFRISFRGTTRNNRIRGFQWQGIFPADVDPEPMQPMGGDTLFLRAGPPDTTAFTAAGDTLWKLRGDTVTVFYRSSRSEPIPPGNFVFRARVRDEAKLVSLFSSGTRRVTVNYDPQSRILPVPACDCPNALPDCAGRDSVAAGWVVGIDRLAFPDTTQWRLFCSGDTLPQLAWVRFFSSGRDDQRDVPIHPAGLREVGFAYRFDWAAGQGETRLENRSMPFSEEIRAGSYRLPPPYGLRRGDVNGWGRQNQGLCPFSFTFSTSAVDEHGKRDGTPDMISFHVGGAPSIDSLGVPSVVVLVPKCPDNQPLFCPASGPYVFGPDTVAVLGVHVPRPGGIFPLALGTNRFTLPLRAWGHDHPRDRPTPGGPDYYSSVNAGRIRSWRFSFDCVVPGCQDLALIGEDQWRNDVNRGDPDPGQQAFDDDLQIEVVLDTLCTVPPGTPCGFGFKLAISPSVLGSYLFEIQGRDTDALLYVCPEPSDLGSDASIFLRSVADQGLTTPVARKTVKILQLQDVRPYVPEPALRAAGAGQSKRLMR